MNEATKIKRLTRLAGWSMLLSAVAASCGTNDLSVTGSGEAGAPTDAAAGRGNAGHGVGGSVAIGMAGAPGNSASGADATSAGASAGQSEGGVSGDSGSAGAAGVSVGAGGSGDSGGTASGSGGSSSSGGTSAMAGTSGSGGSASASCSPVCSGNTPACVNGSCHACRNDGDCKGSTPACQPSGACGQCSASNTKQCTAGTPVCLGSTCVACSPDDLRCDVNQPQKCSSVGQWVNQPVCTAAAPTCSNGGCLCTETVCGGKCVDPDVSVADCGGCGHACVLSNASTRACSGGLCAPSCKSGFQDCGTPLPPNADDGCECAGTACCGSACQTKHSSNGTETIGGQVLAYFSCSAGIDSTSALDACNQYLHSNGNVFSPGDAYCALGSGCAYLGDSSRGTEYAWFFADANGAQAGDVWFINSNNSGWCSTSSAPYNTPRGTWN